MFKKKKTLWRSLVAQRVKNPISVHEDSGSSLASLCGLRILCCCELRCSLQTFFGSHVTVAVGGGRKEGRKEPCDLVCPIRF